MKTKKIIILLLPIFFSSCLRRNVMDELKIDSKYLSNINFKSTKLDGFTMIDKNKTFKIAFGKDIYHIDGELKVKNNSILYHPEYAKDSTYLTLFDSKNFVVKDDSIKIKIITDFYLQIYREPNFIYNNDTIMRTSLKVINPLLLSYKLTIGFSTKKGFLFINYDDDCKEEHIIINENANISVHKNDKGCNLMEI